jgi:transcriptional regulator with XRE-family HTH domain
MEFSQIVKSLRLERGWSQQEVADRAGLNKMTISQYENGKRKPSFEVIEALAETFHVDMNYLLGYTDRIAPETRTRPCRIRLVVYIWYELTTVVIHY